MDRSVDVDIVTGRPLLEEEEKKRNKKEAKLLEERKAIENDLRGEGGAVLQHLILQFRARVAELIKVDPECRGYAKILSTLKYKINVAKKVVDDYSLDIDT